MVDLRLADTSFIREAEEIYIYIYIYIYIAYKRQMKNFVFRSLEATLKNTPSPLICHGMTGLRLRKLDHACQCITDINPPPNK